MERQVYMTPRQPFFVTSSESYSKYIMNRYGIVHFYQCKTGEQPRYAIPDGCVDMVFCCDSAHPYAKLCGTVLAPKAVLMEPNTCYFGVRFLPGYNPIVGNGSIMKELVDNRIPLEIFVQDKRMLEEIFSTTNFQRQIHAFMRSYIKIYHDVCPIERCSLLVLHSCNLLIRSYGCITMEKIADDTGYTVRYLNKMFHRETGLSPKQFAKIIRFQSAVSALNNPGGRILTEITAELGYFDQSHFVHEFKEYTGLTPKRYQSYLKNHDFQQKLNILDAC